MKPWMSPMQMTSLGFGGSDIIAKRFGSSVPSSCLLRFSGIWFLYVSYN